MNMINSENFIREYPFLNSKASLFSPKSDEFYTYQVISVFEKFLKSERDLETQLTPLVSPKYNPKFDKSKFKIQSDKLLKFYNYLINFPCYLIILEDDGELVAFDCDDEFDVTVRVELIETKLQFNKICKMRVKELELMQIVVPYFGLVVATGFDFTDALFFRRTIADKNKVAEIESYYKLAGLFRID